MATQANLGEAFKTMWGMSPLEAAAKYGKGSPILIEMLNQATSSVTGKLGPYFKPTGSLAGDIIRTAAPGIALAVPALLPLLPTTLAAPVASTVAAITNKLAPLPAASGGKMAGIADLFVTSFAAGPQQNGGNLLSTILRGVAGELSKAGSVGPFGTADYPFPGIVEKLPQGMPDFSKVKAGRSSTAGVQKRRHMNSLNPHALRRATSRISSFHRFAANAEKAMAKAFRKGGFHVSSGSRRAAKCATCRKTKCTC